MSCACVSFSPRIYSYNTQVALAVNLDDFTLDSYCRAEIFVSGSKCIRVIFLFVSAYKIVISFGFPSSILFSLSSERTSTQN